MKRSQRLQGTPPYPFARWNRQIDALRGEGLDVIRLDIGSPDLPPPEEVVEALCASAHQPDRHSYPGYRGIPALRDAIAEYYARRFGVTLDPEGQVVPLIGSKEGIVNLALACLDPGDLVLVPDPGYAPYTLGAHLAGAQVYTFPLLPERAFLPDFDAIPAHVLARATLMWLNYPNNPTGATADLEFLAQAVALAQHHGFLLCHDAPYCDVTFDGYKAPSLLQVPGASQVAVEFNSFSKTWNMAERRRTGSAGAGQIQCGHRHLPPAARGGGAGAYARPTLDHDAQRNLPGAPGDRPGGADRSGYERTASQSDALCLGTRAPRTELRDLRPHAAERDRGLRCSRLVLRSRR